MPLQASLLAGLAIYNNHLFIQKNINHMMCPLLRENTNIGNIMFEIKSILLSVFHEQL